MTRKWYLSDVHVMKIDMSVDLCISNFNTLNIFVYSADIKIFRLSLLYSYYKL